MNICMVIAEFNPNMGRPPLYIANYLKRKGHKVTIITSDLDVTNKKIKKIKELKGVKTIRLKGYFFRGKVIPSPSFFFKIASLKSDILYLDGFEPITLLSGFAGMIRRVPIALRADWSGRPTHGLKNIYSKYIKFPVLSKSDAIMIFSEDQKRKMIGMGISSSKLHVVPNGVGFEQFTSKKSNYLRRLLKMPKTNKIILSVSRIRKSKNIKMAIKAFCELYKKHKNISFVNVGWVEDENYNQNLLKIIKESQLKNVHFLPEISHTEIKKVYSSADIFVLTSDPKSEGMNLSTFEAMASGLPIVTTSVNVTSEVVKNADCGFVVNTLSALVKALDTLLKNKKLTAKLGKNAREEARKFSWEIICGRVEKIIMDVYFSNKKKTSFANNFG